VRAILPETRLQFGSGIDNTIYRQAGLVGMPFDALRAQRAGTPFAPTLRTLIANGFVTSIFVLANRRYARASDWCVKNPKAAPGSRRWDSPETASFANLAPLDASLDLLLRIGLDEIAAHNRALTRILVERLPRDRFILTSPGEEARRGPYVCLAARNPAETEALHEKLREAQIITALRQSSVRISPHLMNTIDDMERVVRVLAVA